MTEHERARSAPVSHTPPLQGRPSDAEAFVAAAQEAANLGDLDWGLSIYADNPTLTAITDGGHESHVGAEQVRRAVTIFYDVFRATKLRTTKRIVAATDDTIVNDWVGVRGRRREARGVEIWIFDDHGKVRDQTLYSFLDVRPSRSGTHAIRALAMYPRTAVAFARAAARHRTSRHRQPRKGRV